MDIEEYPSLRNVVQESAGATRTHRATETMQKGQSKGLLFSTVQDRGRDVAWKKGEEKPQFTHTVVELIET